ncbi:hypothetical protein [Kribbella deserti]|uniref:Uncharacterized protein n=1 Tax=Kribbella deserti TaxID=1926257 RepID=A0ABV6QZ33_9ACTN
MELRQRNRALTAVFGWAVLVIVGWVVALLVAPDGGAKCADQGFGCSADIELLVFVVGMVVGLPVLIGTVIVSLVTVAALYWSRPGTRYPVLIGTVFFWAYAAAGVGVWWITEAAS